MALSMHLFPYITLAVALPLLMSVDGGGFVFPGSNTARPRPRPVVRQSVMQLLNSTDLACVAQQKVLHSDGKCYHLRHKGPCSNEQWLVLDDGPVSETGRRRTVCKTNRCPKPLQVFWPLDGQCHRLSEMRELCPLGGNVMRSDSYGDGECACNQTYVRWESDVVNNPNSLYQYEGICYPLYHKGPCRGDTILNPKVLPGFGIVGRCIRDPCRMMNAQNPNSIHAQLPNSQQCYRLNEPGFPCAAGKKFVVHPLSLKPACYSGSRAVATNTLYDDMEERCGGNIDDLTKECRDELEVRTSSLQYAEDMMGKPRPPRRVRPG